MRTCDVIIVGGGPVGLSLALGLARKGISSVVLEKKSELSPYSRALAVHARTLEILQEWGCADGFLSQGQFLRRVRLWEAPANNLVGTLDFSPLAARTAFPGLLALPQDRTEALLLGALRATGSATVHFGTEVVQLERGTERVVAIARGPAGEERFGARYLVGCDGAHSKVRQTLGWRLEGSTYGVALALADIELDDTRDAQPWPRFASLDDGTVFALRVGGGRWRLIATHPTNEEDAAAGHAWWRSRADRVLGPGPFHLVWESPFQIHRRLSPHFRLGNVFLAGDAAHLNSPAGGQGMNAGIQDAHNLVWKLVRVLNGTGDSERLLSSYESERRYAFETSVSRYTNLLTGFVFGFLGRPLGQWLGRVLVPRLLASRTVRERLLPTLTMLDTTYPPGPLLGEGALVGHLAPDGEVEIGARRFRLREWAAGQGGLVSFGQAPSSHPCEVASLVLPARGPVARAWRARSGTTAFIRPDGYLGWRAESPSPAEIAEGLAKALGLKVSAWSRSASAGAHSSPEGGEPGTSRAL